MSDTTTSQTPTVAVTVDRYLEGLHEQDATKRTQLIEQAWVAEGHYLDPLQDETGREAIGEIAPRVEQHYPGHRFRRTSEVDVHHDRVRFGWELAGPDGTVAVAGIDVGRLASDSRLETIVGFFD